MDIAFLYGPKNRTKSLAVAIAMILSIAFVDWATKRYVALGFLYLFPIMLAGGFLSRPEIFGLSLFCAVLHEVFSGFPPPDAVRTMMVTVAFSGTGLFVSELARNRQLALTHLDELEEQVRFRRDAEAQLRMLIDTSPAAIVIMDSDGTILLANEATRELFAATAVALEGQSIRPYLPDLCAAAKNYGSRVLRTAMQCKGQRQSGDVFLAATWFSTYKTSTGTRLAAIVVDLSEELRDREELSLNHLLKNARLLVGAVCHEIRNLCSAVSVVQKNLSREPGLSENQDFQALTSLTEGLKNIASMELQPSSENRITSVDVQPILDELRILIETSFKDAEMTLIWKLPETLPLVWADRYGLLQVFLNITKNSLRAMKHSPRKELTIEVLERPEGVAIYFEDSGPGIREPELLFHPFQPGADMNGLGLYISRAILRTFQGELQYEPRSRGTCFAASLRVVEGEAGLPRA